jgi:hypothetical protein
VQLPPDNVHDAGPNVPPALLSVKEIIPVGVTGEFDVSVTDIVRVTDPPLFSVLELDTIEVLVECNGFVVVELADVALVLVWLSA